MLSKILATTALVGMMGTAAFANEINFTQTSGAIATVRFVQTGTGNIISATGIDNTNAATVTGSLQTLRVEQIGGSNQASFAITAPTGRVDVFTSGNANTSKLSVTQLEGSGNTLDYSVRILGDDNTVDSTISALKSLVKINSNGTGIAYDIDQTGTGEDTKEHSITANVSKTGASSSNITLNQSGALNTIAMGTVGDLGASGGLTLNGGAIVNITQSSAAATYISASHTIADNGSLFVTQE